MPGVIVPLLCSQLRFVIGGSAAPGPPAELSALPRPVLKADAAAPLSTLRGPLKALAMELAPGRILVECGGQGQCGPNCVAYLLGFVGHPAITGTQLRQMVVSHAQRPDVRAKITSIADGSGPITMEALLCRCMARWPNLSQLGLTASVESWCQAMVLVDAWVDISFMQMAADLFQIAIHVIAVDGLEFICSMGSVKPCHPARPVAVIEIGCFTGHHFMAIGDVRIEAAAGPSRLKRMPPLAMVEELGNGCLEIAGELMQLDDSGVCRSESEHSVSYALEAVPSPRGSCEEESEVTESAGCDDITEAEPFLLMACGGPESHEDSMGPALLEGSKAANTVEGVSLPERSLISLRAVLPAMQSLSILLCVSTIIQPLILAHIDGFTITGLQLPSSSRALAMKAVQRLCATLFSGNHVAFLVGQYDERRRVFATVP